MSPEYSHLNQIPRGVKCALQSYCKEHKLSFDLITNRSGFVVEMQGEKAVNVWSVKDPNLHDGKSNKVPEVASSEIVVKARKNGNLHMYAGMEGSSSKMKGVRIAAFTHYGRSAPGHS